MDEEQRPSPLRDALVTIAGVWAALILAGLSGLRLQPSIAGAAISLAVCLLLLVAWAVSTGPGRRTHLGVYVLAGLLYWVVCSVMFLTVPLEAMMSGLQWVTAGTVIGYQYEGGPHAPLEYYLVPMVLNLFGPILAMGAIRALIRAI